MEISDLKKISDKSYDIALAKQNALEKIKSRMLVAHDGHLLKADAETINLIKTLLEDRKEFVILDVNDNPCHITDPDDFLGKLIERNQETLNAYQQLHQDLAKKTS